MGYIMGTGDMVMFEMFLPGDLAKERFHSSCLGYIYVYLWFKYGQSIGNQNPMMLSDVRAPYCRYQLPYSLCGHLVCPAHDTRTLCTEPAVNWNMKTVHCVCIMETGTVAMRYRMVIIVCLWSTNVCFRCNHRFYCTVCVFHAGASNEDQYITDCHSATIGQ